MQKKQPNKHTNARHKQTSQPAAAEIRGKMSSGVSKHQKWSNKRVKYKTRGDAALKISVWRPGESAVMWKILNCKTGKQTKKAKRKQKTKQTEATDMRSQKTNKQCNHACQHLHMCVHRRKDKIGCFCIWLLERPLTRLQVEYVLWNHIVWELTFCYILHVAQSHRLCGSWGQLLGGLVSRASLATGGRLLSSRPLSHPLAHLVRAPRRVIS